MSEPIDTDAIRKVVDTMVVSGRQCARLIHDLCDALDDAVAAPPEGEEG